MKGKRISPSHLTTIKELYKCHFTAKELANMMFLSYAIISNIYRGFRMAKITKYDRLELATKCNINKYYITAKPQLFKIMSKGININTLKEKGFYNDAR